MSNTMYVHLLIIHFVRLLLYLLFGLRCMFGHCRRMMYDVLFLPVMTSCLMRCLFFFNYS